MDNVIMPSELTAENGAKGLLIGEFSVHHRVDCGACDDGDGSIMPEDEFEPCELCGGQGGFDINIPIPWTTIKEIYKKSVEGLRQDINQQPLRG